MTRLRRLGLIVVALVVCAVAGWQAGRLAGPNLPPPGVVLPAGGGHSH